MTNVTNMSEKEFENHYAETRKKISVCCECSAKIPSFDYAAMIDHAYRVHGAMPEREDLHAKLLANYLFQRTNCPVRHSRKCLTP